MRASRIVLIAGVIANLRTWGWITLILWSLTIIAMDVVALYGLCAYGSRENVEAAYE